jgi:hypothetical protein
MFFNHHAAQYGYCLLRPIDCVLRVELELEQGGGMAEKASGAEVPVLRGNHADF